jgi:hypothetical protein
MLKLKRTRATLVVAAVTVATVLAVVYPCPIHAY